MKLSVVPLAALVLAAAAALADAQVLFTGAYTQDFSSMTGANATVLPAGWVVGKGDTTTLGTTGVTSTASSTASGVYEYYGANTTTKTAVALGGLSSSGATTTVAIVLQLTNNTGASISSLSLSFDALQWAQISGATNTLEFGYYTGATSQTKAGFSNYTAASAFNFISPSSTGSGVLSASAALATSTNVNGTLNLATPWANGNVLDLVWYVPATSAGAIAMGIQDVTVNAVPEPSSGALAAGGGALLLALGWRRLRPARS